MAKSTRQCVFEGMKVLPEALTPFVEKRLESALTGHWRIRVAEKLRLHADPSGGSAWDQAALLNAMDRVCAGRLQDRAWTRRTLDRERIGRRPEQALAQRSVYL